MDPGHDPSGLLDGGRKHLPRSAKSWNKLLDKVAPQYSLVGATLFFAFAAASALGELGLSEDLAVFMSRIEALASSSHLLSARW
ncbi:hypothetical protein [Brevibacterium sp. UCMA 11754]|uniref:hypothetical protein n=1 Tax=Brevibacterium sp. UCMA 11754 TaxID=2749198 RepID=UPI001F3C8DD6|nr:hypothetical protein [Brevibacterium sp. UCMA 11754]